MKKESWPEGKYMGTVKVGPKGQIIVPKEVRDLFNIKPGDMLLVLADINAGIAIHSFDETRFVFDKLFPNDNKK
ncbi:MAG: AbrB/MazE/SpoVT family DNA-binding domain-containing protein [Christensenellaceae bacterium]|nr:AbrB/MazE/SpoVT family DNA-binding domain-containing protein [Christensenellaceae bacterium]